MQPLCYAHIFPRPLTLLHFQLVPFWPLSDDNRMVVTVGNDENAVKFNYRKPDTVSLKFENEVYIFLCLPKTASSIQKTIFSYLPPNIQLLHEILSSTINLGYHKVSLCFSHSCPAEGSVCGHTGVRVGHYHQFHLLLSRLCPCTNHQSLPRHRSQVLPGVKVQSPL